MTDKPKFSFGAKPVVPKPESTELTKALNTIMAPGFGESPKPVAGPKAFGALFGQRPKAEASEAPESEPAEDSSVSVEDAKDAPAPSMSFTAFANAMQEVSTPASGSELPSPAMAIVPAEPDAVELPDMAANLAALDKLFVEGHGYPELALSSVRSRIKDVMQELKEKPELLSIVQAKDTRNIMAYIQQTQMAAIGTFKEKTVKSAKAATKKAAKASFSFEGFGNAVEQAASAALADSRQINLEGLAKVDLSKMMPKTK